MPATNFPLLVGAALDGTARVWDTAAASRIVYLDNDQTVAASNWWSPVWSG